MSIVRSTADIEQVVESGRRLARVMCLVRAAVRPGVTTAELDAIARQGIEEVQAVPVFLGYQGYPAALCTSVNCRVVHGIPSGTEVLSNGDIIGLDLGLRYQGWITDMAITVPVGAIDRQAQQLIETAQQALALGISKVRPGARIGAVGAAIQAYVESRGHGVVRDLTGHGVGRMLHDEPTIPNFGSPNSGPLIEVGMLLAIEPMVTTGDWHVRTLSDGWTVETLDRSLSSHFEHTVLVTEQGARIITQE